MRAESAIRPTPRSSGALRDTHAVSESTQQRHRRARQPERQPVHCDQCCVQATGVISLRVLLNVQRMHGFLHLTFSER